jgi:hypothetical protein
VVHRRRRRRGPDDGDASRLRPGLAGLAR